MVQILTSTMETAYGDNPTQWPEPLDSKRIADLEAQVRGLEASTLRLRHLAQSERRLRLGQMHGSAASVRTLDSVLHRSVAACQEHGDIDSRYTIR